MSAVLLAAMPGQEASARVALVDDVISTGGTLAAPARLLLGRGGAASAEAVAAHALYTDENAAVLREAAPARVRSTDSVPHPSNAISAAPALAAALAEEIAGGSGGRDRD